MKRILSTILLCVTILCAYSQEDITLFFLNDGSFKGFYDEEIDSITYSHLDLDSVWHSDAVVQEVWLADSVVRIPIEKIDSICHKVPDPEYKPGVIHLDERYLPYITSVDGLTISFSSGLSENLWPKEGSVLLYEGSNNIFPNGFAGTVTKLVDGVAVCDSAAVDDVYERLYFFGSYVLAEDGEGTGTYSAKKIRSRHADDKDDDWGIFEVDPTNIPFDKIKIAEKIDISRANMFAAISGTITPTVTVEAAYVFNVYEPLIFFKATHRFEYDALLQVGFNKDFTPKHHKDIGKPFRMHKLDENRDEKGFHLYFINESVPIPQCPVLTAGFKMGLFIDPKIEAEVVLGLHIQASEDKTHIYRLDKNNIGRLGEWWKGNGPEPETSSCEIELDGSLTGSVWAGLMAAINVGVGTDKCGMKEELSARIGPYIEGKLNLDFMDLNKDMSWYSGLKDSKIKRGIKSAFNLDFTAKMPKVFSYKWTQLELSPPKLFFEQDCYLLPAFEAPTYSVQGNSLKCYTSVTRSTVPNHIGLRVKDESGKEVTKWQNFTFDFADKENPYVISETFDNLDFANHRYTIIPVTRIWELPALEIPEPNQTCVTCPDSRHPHLIDLGLPSGTKWLCSNLYADDPKDAGGYYQWGKPFMVHAYNDLTYRAPSFAMANYQSSEHDAATANLGQEYCTPTMSQFNELHDNCSMDYKYSPWGNNVLGVFLKGKNGNNLYLPFSGFKSGVKVNNKSEGCFLSSDAVDSDNNLQRKAVVIKNNDAIWHSTDALAYGYSVRPVSAGSDGLVIEPQQLDYEVYVGQKVGQSVTVTNNGSAPVSVTVTQTTAPFQVDNACLGTFTVSPKKQQSVLVYFSPTEEKEYTSVLTLSYGKDNACVVSKVPLKGKGINASNIPLQLSTTTLTLTIGQQGMVDITSGNGEYTVESSNTNVATVSVSSNIVTVNAITEGAATITVKDIKSGHAANVMVTVMSDTPSTPVETEIFTINGVSFKMIAVEGGSFMMGSSGDTPEADDDEKPQHQVTLNDFAIGETEVTQALWETVMSGNPSTYKGPNMPVENVTFDDCVVFIYRLNEMTGRNFRLPTEAEWEYAARGGKYSHGYKYSGSDDIDAVAWYENNAYYVEESDYGTHAVATKQPNELGLYDMSGNVWEICEDWYNSNYYGESPSNNPCNHKVPYYEYHVLRGGGWHRWYRDCRVTNRAYESYNVRGLRLVLTNENESPLYPDLPSKTYAINGVSFTMVGVKGGTFWMGATDDDSEASDDERPRHLVLLNSFNLAQTEVTQALWEAVMDDNPSEFKGANRPVDRVNRSSCNDFIHKLNQITGLIFRMPTEAEWEYAARGGKKANENKYAGSNNIDAVAWYEGNSNSQTHPVAQKQANELGLYDMSGNVVEWCKDELHGNKYPSTSAVDPCYCPSARNTSVVRGGSWKSKTEDCRIVNRDGCTNDSRRYNYVGIRLAQTPGGGFTCPDDSHPHVIDLGLPSGTKWSCCNVDISHPEFQCPTNYGSFFAWGETESKNEYDWSTYIHCDGSSETCHDIGNVIAGTKFDAAHNNWGGTWRIPNYEQISELHDYCTSEWTTCGAIVGRRYTGPNGNTIFLPAAGYHILSSHEANGSGGYYWSSNLDSSNSKRGSIFCFDKDEENCSSIVRLCGLSVRPVTK